MAFDIYIYPEAKGKSAGIRIPWLPNEIAVDLGELRAAEYQIMDLGEVNIPSGSNLGTISWSATFPGEGHNNLPFLMGEWKDPSIYRNKLNEWKEKGTELKIIVTGTTINHKVYCQSFAYKYSGGAGDITYDVAFKTRREVEVTTVKKTSTAAKNKTKSPSSSTKTYKIVRGDTLWGISVKYLGKGSRWKEIYNLNKDIIESTAKKYGKKSSDGGHWIYPGCVIKIPAK